MKQILHAQNFSTKATEWGKENEPIALKKYVEQKTSSGHAGLIAVKAGFVICEEIRASPDAYVNDPTSVDQFGLAEIKCPYKYRDLSPQDAAMNPDLLLAGQ